jgi:hypothetical protein
VSFPCSQTWNFPWNKHFSHLKRRSFQEYSYDKLTNFSKGKRVEDTPGSHCSSVLTGHTCVFFFHQYMPFYCKENDCPTWKHWMVGSTLLKFQLSSQWWTISGF